MTKQDFIDHLSVNGKLIPKRCCETYINEHNLMKALDVFVCVDFGTIGDRIRHVKYGGGYCIVCGVRTNNHVSGKGFAKYCAQHFHKPKCGKIAHNKKHIDVDKARLLYEQGNSIIHIANVIGGVSNVTVKKALIQSGVELRSHSANQKLHCTTRNQLKPRVVIDRSVLVHRYKTDNISMETLAHDCGCHVETIRRFLIQEGVERCRNRSYIEEKIISILTQHNINFKQHNRKIISPLELDIVIPEHNIAIEINGLYTHSLYSGKKDKQYHFTKHTRAIEKGIRLFQFWENDINNRIDIIESIILNACNRQQNKLNARQCVVSSVDYTTLSKFCNTNHLQGAPGKNAKGIGLYHNGELVSLITYVVSSDVTVVTRFCSKLNKTVRGGFTRLCKYVPGKIIKTYSSNDISVGHLYSRSGFECTTTRSYDLWYTDYKNIFNRQKFMKKKQRTILDKYDHAKTEVENMFENGYDTIYKSGTKTWIFKR